jgi:DedD protein
LPADLNSVVPDKPAATANVAAPAVAAVAAVGAIAAGQASKPTSRPAPASRWCMSRRRKKRPANLLKPSACRGRKQAWPRRETCSGKHKQPDPAAILAGHFDEEPATKPATVKKSESKPEKVDNVGNGKSSSSWQHCLTRPRPMHSRANCLAWV